MSYNRDRSEFISATRKAAVAVSKTKVKTSFESDANFNDQNKTQRESEMHADVDFTDIEQEEAFYQIEFGIPRMKPSREEEFKEGENQIMET